MARETQSQGGGRPTNFRNLSPFTGPKKGAERSGHGYLVLGLVGILAWIALILCTLIMKP